MAETESFLETKGVIKRFGGLTAVNKMNFTIDRGRIFSIIGPNGAGKTTFFNTISGIYRADEGSISFKGRQIGRLPPDAITAHRIARTFQNIRLFNSMTVVENIMVGGHTRLKQSPIEILLRLKRFKDEERTAERRAEELMEYVGVHGLGNELASNLPYGAQRRVEIARALAAEPELLLLDEPTAGMNPNESEDALQLFRRLRDDLGIAILLIEHAMRVVMKV